MKTLSVRFLLFLMMLLLGFSTSSLSMSAGAAMDRSLALESISQTDTASVLAPLFQLARTGDDTELLEALDAFASQVG